ncbi:MAG: ACT domain-containing protein [Gordonia sp. (in: high G+C Gram-positive bacteria)]|uniref:ACT domain-containing protein n=1 Tax=Gordonia sp. (in: high G+C Gram-positive bacteria) TaxID=84139 RepID=UPI0039E21EEE
MIGAASLTTSVSRPDLLLLGALIHDIGKGRGGDHSEIGAEIAVEIGKRLGLWPHDVEILSAMVRYHLLLPSTATRRDPTDPKIVESVADTLGRDRVLVELLGALAQADGQATGAAAWSDWKASLIAGLTGRLLTLIGGAELPEPEPLTADQAALAEEGGLHVRLEAGDGPTTYVATLVAPDRPGLLSRMAGVLAASGLTTHSAHVRSHAGHAVNSFVVMPAFGDPPDVQVLRQRLRKALEGVDVVAGLADGEDLPPVLAPPRATWVEDSACGSLLLEVRSADRPALLARISAVLERAGADVIWATVTTLGSTVIDTFSVELSRDTPGARDEIAEAVLRVCPGPAHPAR